MTLAQIGWAASHDWFIRSEPSLALAGAAAVALLAVPCALAILVLFIWLAGL